MKLNNRARIITETIKHFNYNTYLEVGLRDKTSVFNHVPCEIKYSVDTDKSCKPSYCGTSDSFFEQEKIKDVFWDVIFIDACHLVDFVYRDLMNSLQHLNNNGVIFLHDVLPTKFEFTYENGDCQTAWKVIPYILKNHPELRACTLVDGNAGLGVVVKGQRTELLEQDFNKFYEYNIMDKNRIKSQNTIQLKNLFSWIKNEEIS